ncbi:hypothetical protein L5515_014249 [Caenorhabditis briggsae]|uniref:PPM-type phosphatase domain-containing protein n=1 Tax=Caenorhabditis briggsae TaxID=6238 RepID=A0AAE9EFG9_CAEBR|nr:hypothetical protein L5515_014249 [Caenorhabditis briggsae]
MKSKDNWTPDILCIPWIFRRMDYDQGKSIRKERLTCLSILRPCSISGFITSLITSLEQFAIIACDGLWKSFSNVEAVTYASEQLEVAKKMDIQQEPNESRKIAELRIVAERLASEAVRRKCGDNVSVIVVKLELIDC